MNYIGGIERTLRYVAKNGKLNEPDATLMEDAATRIAELESLLHRIDAVTTWETTPLGRGFQGEIDAALRRRRRCV